MDTVKSSLARSGVVPGRNTVTLWVSARMAGTGQINILDEQAESSSRRPMGARRSRRKRINSGLSLGATRGWRLTFARRLPDFSDPPIWGADHSQAGPGWKA